MYLQRSLLIASVAASALMATACAKADRTYSDTASGSLDTTEAVRVADVKVGRGIGADKKVVDVTDNFTVRDTIYASVRTTGTASGSTLTARWTFEDSVTVQEQTASVAPMGEAFTEFHITKATAWPKGKYKLAILLNGKEVETESFTIK